MKRFKVFVVRCLLFTGYCLWIRAIQMYQAFKYPPAAQKLSRPLPAFVKQLRQGKAERVILRLTATNILININFSK
jgi:hypothetical protein